MYFIVNLLLSSLLSFDPVPAERSKDACTAILGPVMRCYTNMHRPYFVTKRYTMTITIMIIIIIIIVSFQRLDIVRSTGDHTAEICTLCNLGNCLRATGKLQEAVENYSLVIN